MFIKVDKTYALSEARIGIQNNISHYSLVGSIGANKNSMF